MTAHESPDPPVFGTTIVPRTLALHSGQWEPAAANHWSMVTPTVNAIKPTARMVSSMSLEIKDPIRTPTLASESTHLPHISTAARRRRRMLEVD